MIFDTIILLKSIANFFVFSIVFKQRGKSSNKGGKNLDSRLESSSIPIRLVKQISDILSNQGWLRVLACAPRIQKKKRKGKFSLEGRRPFQSNASNSPFFITTLIRNFLSLFLSLLTRHEEEGMKFAAGRFKWAN